MGWLGQSDTPRRLVLASGNPRVLVLVTRGLPALLHMMVKYSPHRPPQDLLQPCNQDLDGSQGSGPGRNLGLGESGERPRRKQHPHRLQCSGGGLFADVGRAWQGSLGLASKGAIRRLETDSPSQVRGRAQELAVCVRGVEWRVGPNLYERKHGACLPRQELAKSPQVRRKQGGI